MLWIRRLFERQRLDRELDKELRFHLDQHAVDLIARGLDPEEALRQARLALGGPEQVKEECRDVRGTRWIEDLWQDSRYALRTLRRHPGFTTVAILTLALGIGATTVMFTLINGVLLKPFSYQQPEQLVRVHGYSPTWNTALYGDQNLSYPDFLDCVRECRSLVLAGRMWDFATLSDPGEPEHVVKAAISSNLFSLLGVQVFRGRAFLAEEDRRGGLPAVILGYNFWQRRFGGNPAVLGTTVVLDTKPYTVVGITAPEFRLEDSDVDVYTPLGQDTYPILQRRGPHPIGVLGRFKPGYTLAQVNTELALIGRHLAEQYPDTNKDRSFIMKPLRPDVGDVRSTLWLLLGTVSLVLLIACVNIASLLLARAVSRERQFAIRIALGAGRGRLVRQCLTESALLALAGGALGVILAALGIRPFTTFWPGSLPRAEEVRLDWYVLLFSLALSLASGLLFGLVPALRAPSRGPDQALRAGARTVAGSSRRLHGALVTSEIALAVVLLISAGTLGRALLKLSAVDPGLNIHNVLIARTALSPSTLPDPARTRATWQDLLDRAQRVPGVQAIAIVDTVPMRSGNNPIGYRTAAAPVPENQQPVVLATSVTPDYLKVTGIPLRQGRFLTEQDHMGNQSVAVIDEVMAQQAFGSEDPIGKQLWIDLGSDPVTVIGVVGHVRYWGLAGDDQAQVRAQLYYPFAQVPDRLVRRWSELMSIAVRTDVDPLTLVEPLRHELRGATGDQVLYQIRTLEQLASATLAHQRFLLLVFGMFAGLALLLACIGIYGVLAYLTSQRVPEIGVRIALGATAREVMWLVLRQSLVMIISGAVVGLAAALAAARVLIRLIEGVRSTEPLTFAVMISVLVAAALFAGFLPARRACRVDPVSALRQE